MAVTYVSFLCLCLVAILLKYYQTNGTTGVSIITQLKHIAFPSSQHPHRTNLLPTTKKKQIKYIEFKSFQKRYISAFIIAMLSDWMQGPYVYNLYFKFGYSTQDIAYLYILGAFTAAVTGAFIGSFSDKFGRKFSCLIFCVFYGISCLTKHFRDWYTLCIGRILTGIATSILHSSFEAWMVTTHHQNRFNSSQLTETFQLAWSLNSIMAIFAGIITSLAISGYKYIYFNIIIDLNTVESINLSNIPNTPTTGQNIKQDINEQTHTHDNLPVFEVAAFDCALIALIITYIIIWREWKENYGNYYLNAVINNNNNKDKNSDIVNSDDYDLNSLSTHSKLRHNTTDEVFGEDNTSDDSKDARHDDYDNPTQQTMITKINTAGRLLFIEDRRVLCLGFLQSFFESAMYIFVFCWTPSLENVHKDYVDHGWIFADFMTACLIGTILNNIFTKMYKISHETLSIYISFIASFSMIFVCYFEKFEMKFMLFIIFEICVGMYHPNMGYLRSKYVPDSIRATVMTIFRIPLNIFVVVVLIYIERIGIFYAFIAASTLLFMAAISSAILVISKKNENVRNKKVSSGGVSSSDISDGSGQNVGGGGGSLTGVIHQAGSLSDDDDANMDELGDKSD